MYPLLKKLNFKDHKAFYVINPPEEFKGQLEDIKNFVDVKDKNQFDGISFILIFAKSCSEIGHWAETVEPHLIDDVNLWFAYPKKSSKKYKSDISRDGGWQPLGNIGFEAVRQIAIDEDWSALRFRRAENIKSMKRSTLRAMSETGKKKLK